MIGAQTSLRQQLWRSGYSPIPCDGKRPAPKAWEQKIETNAGEIELWEKVYRTASNTGILTRLTPAIDIDITDEAAAEAVEALARERFEERGYILVRIGKAPKRAVLLRTDTPFPKITRNLTAPNGGEHKIELLCDGQQIIVFGEHPETKRPYIWHGGEPGTIPLDELPYVNRDDAMQFADDAVALLVHEHGYTVGNNRPGATNGAIPPSGQADWSWLIGNLYNGRELHDSSVVLASKMITSGMSDGAAVNMLRGLYESSAMLRDDRWQERYDEIPRSVESARRKFSTPRQAEIDDDEHQQQQQHEPPPLPLPWINLAALDNVQVPEQDWTVLNRFPRRQCVLFSGEGAAGKSTLVLQLCAASAIARDWLGTMPGPGPALFVEAEDDDAVIHRRLAAVVRHYGVSFAELSKNGLHTMSLAGKDAVLAIATKGGKIVATPLYGQLLQAAGDLKPVILGLASSANFFAGNEVDRAQVQQFVGLMTKLAIVSNGSTVLISHPSLTGISSDSGLSGNTQWHNSVRARCYIRGIKRDADNGETTDSDSNLREIFWKKNNYGPTSESIVLRWQNGLFLPVAGVSSLNKMAVEQTAERLFVALLDRFNGQGRNVSEKAASKNYAPTLFAKESDAVKHGVKKVDLENAMRRLFAASQIAVETYGPRCRGTTRLVTR